MVNKLVLFNKGGTLFNMYSLYFEAYIRMFADVFGIENINEENEELELKEGEELKLEDIGTKPSYDLVKEILENRRLDAGAISASMREALSTYDDTLLGLMSGVGDRAREFVCPGVPDLLERLKGERNVNVAVYSGGRKSRSDKALELTGLINYFDSIEPGYYERRHKNRQAVVTSVIEQWERLFCTDSDSGLEVTLVVDTPTDVEIASKLQDQDDRYQVRCIAVATGGYSLDRLRSDCSEHESHQFKPLYVENLRDTQQILKFISGPHQ